MGCSRTRLERGEKQRCRAKRMPGTLMRATRALLPISAAMSERREGENGAGVGVEKTEGQ